MTRLLLISLCILLSVGAKAQSERGRSQRPTFSNNKQREKPEQPKVKVISRLDRATGLSYSDYYKKVEKKDKRIEGLDNFRKLEFVTLTYGNGNRYFGFLKEYNTGYFVKNNFREAWIISQAYNLLLLDKEQYKTEIEMMQGDSGALNFEIELRRTMYDKAYPHINNVNEKMDAKLVIKYFIEREAKKAYFLPYVIDNDGVVTCLNVAAGKDANFKPNDKLTEAKHKMVVASELDINNCYETSLDTFMNFLKEPLKAD